MKAHIQIGSVRLYGFSPPETEEFLCFFRMKRIPAAPIAPDQIHQTVGALFGLPGFSPLTDAKTACAGEQALLFSGFTGQELQALLGALRETGLGLNALKAVITPYNCQWTLARLLQELAAERQHLQKPEGNNSQQ